MIDYVLRATGQTQLFYIGHSQGTTSFFVMTSEKPQYNNKVKLMVAMAPVAYMSNLQNPFFQLLANFHNTIEVCTSVLHMYVHLSICNTLKPALYMYV